MDYLKEIGFILSNIIGLYFFRNKLLDLISRFIQNLNRPLDFIANFLTGAFTSIIRLNYRQQVLHFIIVLIAVVLVLSEFSTLNEVIGATSFEGTKGVNLGFVSVSWSLFSAISYITISTFLGFIGLELINFRRLLQGILFNDPENVSKGTISLKLKIIFISFCFLALIGLAYLQGELALFRYEELAEENVSDALVKYDGYIKGFYFALGFMTPIIAAIALISIDIFLAIIAKGLVVIINALQMILSAIFYALEILILLLSSPIDKLLEFFGIFQPERINAMNKDTATPAARLAPLGNESSIFLQNIGEIFNNYNQGMIINRKLTLICDSPSFKLAIPSSDLQIKKHTTFIEVIQLIRRKYPVLESLNLELKYIDVNGVLTKIKEDEIILDYIRLTNFIYIESF
ncbi:hypothetical protein Q4Q39_01060 [Flavivirga amylovorans]|uniref:Uncharacterized protein n=1 Tax=Flavivirga amylovorans TaxID=870486 RepID=A0ABT8WWC0_9FLAO|nr:hypothetical protein [Flavivirga amylovorans]MDO5985979.1 hypothetical protein [Flavivirga amylovorans]